MPSVAPQTAFEEDKSLHLPRILCLHGGGVNARVFKIQCRVIIAQLKGKFRLVFADGPYASEPGPGMLPTYAKYGPFRRWLRWKPEHPQKHPEKMIMDIDAALKAAMDEDNLLGATGEWIGLLGFSQGAKICASLLLRQQARKDKGSKLKKSSNFKFAVIMAGRGPLVSLDPDVVESPAIADTDELTTGLTSTLAWGPTEGSDHIIRIPTIHVHGLRDSGLRLHRQLCEQYCRKDTRRVVQWDGDHRIPIRSRDVEAVTNKIIEVAKQAKMYR